MSSICPVRGQVLFEASAHKCPPSRKGSSKMLFPSASVYGACADGPDGRIAPNRRAAGVLARHEHAPTRGADRRSPGPRTRGRRPCSKRCWAAARRCSTNRGGRGSLTPGLQSSRQQRRRLGDVDSKSSSWEVDQSGLLLPPRTFRAPSPHNGEPLRIRLVAHG